MIDFTALQKSCVEQLKVLRSRLEEAEQEIQPAAETEDALIDILIRMEILRRSALVADGLDLGAHLLEGIRDVEPGSA